MKKKSYDDEIDISNIIFNLWINKIKIIIITTAFLTLGYLYFSSQNKNFLATTNIKPISTFEDLKYKTYNSLAREDFININREDLLKLFINKIRTEEIIINGIIKFELVNKDDFKLEENYKEQVKKTAISIIDKITPPLKNKRKDILYWKLNFQINEKINWRHFLEYLEKQANEEIRQTLIYQFNTSIEILNIRSKFSLEDIEQNIVNELDNYKISMLNRLAFLKEQAEIARTLNIVKNALEVENFQSDNTNTFVANIKSENSYYLKGYEMIEKEISLINSRKNEKSFIPNLIELEKRKRNIIQNKKNERLKLLFLKTPVFDKDNFVAAKIDYVSTSYKPQQSSLLKILGISIVIGLFISFIFVFFYNLITSRK